MTDPDGVAQVAQVVAAAQVPLRVPTAAIKMPRFPARTAQLALLASSRFSRRNQAGSPAVRPSKPKRRIGRCLAQDADIGRFDVFVAIPSQRPKVSFLAAHRFAVGCFCSSTGRHRRFPHLVTGSL